VPASDEALRILLTRAVGHLRSATDLTLDEIVGLDVLPESMRTPEVSHALGVLEGAATALRATRRELLEDHDLLTAPARS